MSSAKLTLRSTAYPIATIATGRSKALSDGSTECEPCFRLTYAGAQTGLDGCGE
jgi:hypothetical protein